jgi:processive 1,2-diacylglycerol beta-glucosyltransferase
MAKIGIYFSDTGGGHRSAAEAVKDGIASVIEREAKTAVKIDILIQPIIEHSHPITRILVSIYNYLAREHTTWIKHFYHLLHVLRLESNYYHILYRSYMHELLKRQQPSLIVAMHPMIAEALTRARDEVLDPSVKVVVVITDPNEWLWRAWASTGADLIIAPNQIVRRKLIGWGVEPARIRVLGMPVHPAFLSKPLVSRAKFLSDLGLAPNVFTVCINSGWAGNAHLLKTYLALTKCTRSLQVILLCGYNERLHRLALLKARKTGIPTAVLPFYNQMADLMSAVDVMVTKAGGLTTYQALARRLPLVLDNTIEPMPQEAPTMKMLVSCGMATQLNSPEALPKIIDAIPVRPQATAPLPATYELNMTDHAIFDIAKSMLTLQFPNIFTEPSIDEVANNQANTDIRTFVNAPSANIALHR